MHSISIDVFCYCKSVLPIKFSCHFYLKFPFDLILIYYLLPNQLTSFLSFAFDQMISIFLQYMSVCPCGSFLDNTIVISIDLFCHLFILHIFERLFRTYRIVISDDQYPYIMSHICWN